MPPNEVHFTLYLIHDIRNSALDDYDDKFTLAMEVQAVILNICKGLSILNMPTEQQPDASPFVQRKENLILIPQQEFDITTLSEET